MLIQNVLALPTAERNLKRFILNTTYISDYIWYDNYSYFFKYLFKY